MDGQVFFIINKSYMTTLSILPMPIGTVVFLVFAAVFAIFVIRNLKSKEDKSDKRW